MINLTESHFNIHFTYRNVYDKMSYNIVENIRYDISQKRLLADVPYIITHINKKSIHEVLYARSARVFKSY